MLQLDRDFWTTRYQSHQTGWDAGAITTPLKDYFDQLTNKSIKILIPGCGNGYEAEYLNKRGFDVDVVDISEIPLNNLAKRCPEIQESSLIQSDFFELEGAYDLIVEQTFFCSIDPERREEYAKKMHALLKPKGKLVGVLFSIPLYNNRPPFGGSAEEYLAYFTPYFEFKVYEDCENSIKPRKGNELFVNLIRKELKH
ncbi:MAG: methyltransferase domain-containing protein [Cyclobacteriaceae bacterium]|nr:methyltransferase domain-containing protein [Cyclobacteriaceae bacterium]